VHLTLFDRLAMPRQPVDHSNPIPKEKLREFVGCPSFGAGAVARFSSGMLSGPLASSSLAI